MGAENTQKGDSPLPPTHNRLMDSGSGCFAFFTFRRHIGGGEVADDGNVGFHFASHQIIVGMGLEMGEYALRLGFITLLIFCHSPQQGRW